MTAKLAHQVIVCLNVLAAREGMALAGKAGIDLTMVQGWCAPAMRRAELQIVG
jgi:3-hydroxyisobutyrate dehydrogenase-like beta-hydroxyacid dehydrogenase